MALARTVPPRQGRLSSIAKDGGQDRHAMRTPPGPGHVDIVVERSVRKAEVEAKMSGTKLLEDLKAMRLEAQPIRELLEALSPRSRVRKRFEIRCEAYKRKWDSQAIRVQAAFRGHLCRKKYKLPELLKEKKLDKVAAELLKAAKDAIARPQDHTYRHIIGLVDHVLRIHPTSREALLIKARALLSAGKVDEVLETLKGLIGRRGYHDRDARILRVCALVDDGRLEDAHEDVCGMLERDQNDVEVRRLRAWVEGALGKHREAIDTVNVAIEHGGEDRHAYVCRGALNGCLQDWNQAALDLRHALAYREDYVARRFLGRTLTCTRNWGDAVREYRKGLMSSPDDAALMTAMAEAKVPFVVLPIQREDDHVADDPTTLLRTVVPEEPISLHVSDQHAVESEDRARSSNQEDERGEQQGLEGAVYTSSMHEKLQKTTEVEADGSWQGSHTLGSTHASMTLPPLVATSME